MEEGDAQPLRPAAHLHTQPGRNLRGRWQLMLTACTHVSYATFKGQLNTVRCCTKTVMNVKFLYVSKA